MIATTLTIIIIRAKQYITLRGLGSPGTEKEGESWCKGVYWGCLNQWASSIHVPWQGHLRGD